MKKDTYAIALSGGVDSAVAAHLIKQSGKDVFAIFMRNWTDETGFCTGDKDLAMATRIADQLQIRLHVLNLSEEYKNEVFQDFLDDYAQGLTPNPDILCNKNIKFKHLLDCAKELGATKIVTGHYARIINGKLGEGKDPTKDQSYFLCALSEKQLGMSEFPLGDYKKQEVRKIAQSIGLDNYDKKDSTGVCFIEPKHFQSFLQEYILSKPGVIVDENNNIIGKHKGVAFYTIGQRKGLNIGGRIDSLDKPWFVAEKDVTKNTLTVVQGNDHKKLFDDIIKISKPNFIFSESETYEVRIRHLGKKQICFIQHDNGNYFVKLFEPIRAITPGQYAAFYQGEICLGASRILPKK